MSTDQPKKSRGPMGLVLLIVFLDIVGFSILFPLYPEMLDHYVGLEGSGSMIGDLAAWLQGLADDNPKRMTVLFGGLLGSLYSVLQFVFAPIWGGLSDRIGRRPTLLVTLAGTLVGYVLWVFSGSFLVLILSRILCGIMAGNISTATAVVADITKPKDRSKGMAMVGATIGMGFIFGPVIGAVLWSQAPDDTVWGTGFAMNPFSGPAIAAATLAAVNLIGVMIRFPETLKKQAGDVAGHIRVRNPLAQGKSLKAPGITRTNLVYLMAFSAFGAAEFCLTFLAEDRLGYKPTDMKWIFAYSGVIIVIVQGGFVRRMAPKIGEKRLAIAGLVLFIPGLALISQAQGTGLLYFGLTFLGIASALVVPTLSALASLYSPANRQGLALGTFRSMGALARVVGPIFGGLLYWRMGSGAPFYVGAALILIPLALAIGLPPVPEQKDEEIVDTSGQDTAEA
ncbi:MAG: MFS family permease [Planctomycetota bacterium]|jgi:MFS family permease